MDEEVDRGQTALAPWPAHPAALQVNTVVWLAELADALGRQVSLGDVPAAAWDQVVPEGIDVVWLLGVWERSPFGRELALADEVKLAEIGHALPDWTAHDVVSSPFSIHSYTPAQAFGGWEGLGVARRELAARGARLMLDWVPNHMGPDSPWLIEAPAAFMAGTAAELAARPSDFLEIGSRIVARGRDPYFPPWPDVVQVNPFSPALRQLAGLALAEIARHADAVRADMAMLMLDDVVRQVWGERAGPALQADYWTEMVAAVREVNPDFRLIAEVYWDREADLQALGFDYCYDKTLTDRMRHGVPAGIAAHLQADPAYQAGLVRFLENHDEDRAAAAFPPWERQRALSVALATLPGMVLWQEGQAQGRQVHLPMFLNRRPVEAADPVREKFHALIWPVSRRVRTGDWSLVPRDRLRWPAEAVLAWQWSGAGGPETLVLVNLSASPVTGIVTDPGSLVDLLGGAGDGRWDGGTGRYELASWGSLILAGTRSVAD